MLDLPNNYPASMYSVRAIVNGLEMAAPASNEGSLYKLNLQATNNQNNSIILNWNNYGRTYQASGFFLDWYNTSSGQYEALYDRNDTVYTSYTDNGSIHSLIPGYKYNYRLRVKPLGVSDVVGYTSGRSKPNGVISGYIKTPANVNNPQGIGVPGVDIFVSLVGDTLPTNPTTFYSAITDANGYYEINNIYYYEEADFIVTPSLEDRVFNPTDKTVKLKISNNTASADFTDMSSFYISGTIMQESCPMANVQMILNGDTTQYFTDDNGTYSITVSQGGSYIVKPFLENHLFDSIQSEVLVFGNTEGIDFVDTTKYVIEGYIAASCNSVIGQGKLLFCSVDSCHIDSVTTDVNGYYSIKLPARNYNVSLVEFTSSNESLLSSANVLAYFYQPININITYYDYTTFYNDTTSLDLIYRLPITLFMEGISDFMTCSGESIPLLFQHDSVELKFFAQEAFDGNNCSAGSGYLIISENITSSGVSLQKDTIYFQQGDTISYLLIPGTPNIISPYKKFIEAILVIDEHTDTIYQDVIVLGHKPRSQTFTTTTPQVPFHILHNPPGDASYSYLEQSSSLSTFWTNSFLQEGSVDAYIRTQLGPDISFSAGVGAEIQTTIDTQLDITLSLGGGASGLTTDASVITSSATERFETSGNIDIVGGAGDVYVGGAVNLLYAISDALLYDFNTCEIKDTLTLMMQPLGIQTTFIYTESHITDVIIPELQNISDYYTNIGEPDSASFFANQLNVWQQYVDNNYDNINNAGVITNKSFSGGTIYENSVQTTSTKSHSVEMNYYIDYGVAVDLGLSVNGLGIYGGVSVSGRSTFGRIDGNETSSTNTIGYVLSDDDMGDSYSVDIVNDSLYGVPAFRLVAGRSSCPWEQGTLPREGVQLISNTYSQTVEETQQAVFVLQLANTSQSDETMTYDLIFDHTSNPDGAILTIGGSPVVGNVPYPYTIAAGQGTNATITVSKGPTAKTYNGLKFTLKSSCDDQISQDVYLNTHFYHNNILTVAVNGSGTTNIPIGNHPYQEGSNVILFASPSSGYEFQKWVVDTVEFLTQAIQVLMNSDKVATAYFIPSTSAQFTLQISNIGNGSSTPPAGTYVYNEGSTVNLTAIPNLNNAFVKWVINGIDINASDTIIIINQNTIATAYFVQTYMLTVEVASGLGQVFPGEGVYVLHDSALVNLFASSSVGYVFEKWIINSVEYTTQMVGITITENINAKAYFIETTSPQFALTINVVGGGTTNPPAGQHYFIQGSTINLTAYPNNGMLFQKWIINSIETTNNPVNVTITGDVNIQAIFIDDLTEINENNIEENIVSLYPNPTTGVTNVKSNSLIVRIVIYDITGKIVYENHEINSYNHTADLNYLNSGVYFVRLFTKTENSVFKIQIIK